MIDAAYFAASKDRELHFLYGELEPHLPKSGTALELGFGAGKGILWFIERGFKTIAIDKEPMAIECVMGQIPELANVELIEADFAEVEFPPVDVVAAGFSLFMVPKARFPRLWKRIKSSLPSGGLLLANFLGERDEWSDGLRTTHTKRGVKSLLRDFEILYWLEHDREGQTVAQLAKHWHVFHVVACKR